MHAVLFTRIRPKSHLHGSNHTIQEHIWRSIYLTARLAQQWMKEQGIIFDALGPRSIFSGLSGSLGGWLKGALYSVFCPCTFNQRKKNTNTQSHKAVTHQAVYKSVHHNVFLIQEIPPCWIAWWPCVLEPKLFLVSSRNALEKTHMTLNDSTNFWMSLKKKQHLCFKLQSLHGIDILLCLKCLSLARKMWTLTGVNLRWFW